MSIVLGREEWERLCSRADPEYPKSTPAVVEELKQRGFAATEPRLTYYVKMERVTPGKDGGRNLKWYPEDIDLAAACLDEEKLYTSDALMNDVLGISYAQRLEALKEAWAKLQKSYDHTIIPPDPNADYFVMHVYPPVRGLGGHVEYTLDEGVKRDLDAAKARRTKR
jgi:hypothetical protein